VSGKIPKSGIPYAYDNPVDEAHVWFMEEVIETVFSVIVNQYRITRNSR